MSITGALGTPQKTQNGKQREKIKTNKQGKQKMRHK